MLASPDLNLKIKNIPWGNYQSKIVTNKIPYDGNFQKICPYLPDVDFITWFFAKVHENAIFKKRFLHAFESKEIDYDIIFQLDFYHSTFGTTYHWKSIHILNTDLIMK